MKIAHKVMIEIKKENKIWEKYFGLIQVEVNHTYPELYTAGAVLVYLPDIQLLQKLIITFNNQLNTWCSMINRTRYGEKTFQGVSKSS